MSSNKKNLRRISVLVTAQTAFNLKKLAEDENLTEGQMIDEMVCKQLYVRRVWRSVNSQLKADKTKTLPQAYSTAVREEIKRRKEQRK